MMTLEIDANLFPEERLIDKQNLCLVQETRRIGPGSCFARTV